MSTKYTPLKDHDTSIKVLFTGYLSAVAIGYFFALVQILFTHGMADGKFGLSIDDIVYSYYGNRSGTLLETKLNGSMKNNASEKERFKIMQWIRDGADEDEYQEAGIEKIVEQRCVMCHNAESSGLPDFSEFEGIESVTEQDEGATFSSLTRVSHIHLFGISFIFMFIGMIFSFSQTPTMYYKCIAIGMPYAFLVIDILSWWLTKIDPMFAWLIMLAGAGMAMSFAFMWVVSVLEMWCFQRVFVNSVTGELRPQLSTIINQQLQKIGCDTSKPWLKNCLCLLRKLTIYIFTIITNYVVPAIKTLLNWIIQKFKS